MIFTDTHAHLYLPEFNDDRQTVIENAGNAGVKYILLPNIDSGSVESMHDLCSHFHNHCFPMMGLHPTSVKGNFREELSTLRSYLENHRYRAIGEVGIDLYWDKTFAHEQEEVFRISIEWALEFHLPLVIHTRNSFDRTYEILQEYQGKGLTGVFHCFSGNTDQAKKAVEMGFYLGIGGVITFGKTVLEKVVDAIALAHLLLETDAPFLAPVPYRGKRNESSYIPLIAAKVAEIKQVSIETVAEITTENAIELFNL